MKNRITSLAALILAIIAVVLAVGVLAIGGYYLASIHSFDILALGLLSCVIALVGLAVILQISATTQRATNDASTLSAVVTERLEQFSVMINLISEQQLLSERAKSVAFRDKDREALYRAIREEIARGQYDAALLLVNDMDTAFGYRQEADQLRHEIAQLKDAQVRRVVNDYTTQIDRACASEKWDEALELANKLSTLFPTHELSRELPRQVAQRKEAYKMQLLSKWRDAVARKDIDGSVDILRQLDMYVSSSEVAQLKDGALEIFKARIERLRERFKQTVHDKKWATAMQVGEDIIAEFPTSRLAQEVRDMMDMLRGRASEPATAAT